MIDLALMLWATGVRARRGGGRPRRAASTLVPWCVSLVATICPAAVAEYHIARVVSVAGTGNDPTPLPAINDGGSIAFYGALESLNREHGVYRVEGSTGEITPIAGQFYSGTQPRWGRFSARVDLNDAGQVSFVADVNLQPGTFNALTVGDGTGLTTIASNIGFMGQEVSTPLNNSGVVAYVDINNGGFPGPFGARLRFGDGASLTTVITGNNGSPNAYFAPVLNNRGQILFNWPDLDGFRRGLYRYDGGVIETLFAANDPNVLSVEPLAMNDRGLAAYYTRFSIGDYSLTLTDGLTSRTLLTDFRPLNLSDVALNNTGLLALVLDGSLVVGADPSNFTTLISVGDRLDGSIVQSIGFSRHGLNDRGDVAFSVRLADGRQGVYSAVLTAAVVPEPASFAICSLGGVSLIVLRRSIRRAGAA